MIKKLLNTKISKENKKGFTLAELLIVVAIIGVLVAISIPIFTSQLEKSREATDAANVRSAYAECSASCLSGVATDNSVTVTKENGVITAEKTVTKVQTKAGWEGDAPKIEDTEIPGGPGSVKITIKDGKDTEKYLSPQE